MTYPSSLDELTDGVPSDGAAPTTALDSATYPHDDHHRALATAVEAVEAELGTDPSGASATVAARFTATETVANAATPPAEMLGVFSAGSSFVGVPGQGFVATSTGTLTAGRDYYFPFVVRKALTITFAEIQVTTGPASDATIYVGIYAATNDGQPTGSPLLNTTISCTSGATGIKSVSSLAAALPAGNYVSAINTTVSFGIRTFGSAVGTGFGAPLGTGPGQGYVYGTRTAAAFTSSPTVWDSNSFAGALNMATNSLFFKWTTP